MNFCFVAKVTYNKEKHVTVCIKNGQRGIMSPEMLHRAKWMLHLNLFHSLNIPIFANENKKALKKVKKMVCS